MARLSGRNVLSEIDKILTSARGHLDDVDAQFGSTRNQLATLRTRELELFTELAKLRLLELEQGSVIDQLDSVDSQVRKLLEERASALSRLNEQIEAANSALRETEDQRAAQQALVDAAGESLDATEAKAQAALEADETYRQQLAATDRADFVADQAEAKADAAAEDRAEKGQPYEDDPLFAYLWDRGYGTSRYRAFALIRWLDARVARLIGYEPVRRNYATLLEIPVRLGEHAASMRALFDQEASKLTDLEQAAAMAVGVPERKTELEAAENSLAEIDARIAASEDGLRQLVTERAAFSSGKDRYYMQSLALLAEAMQRKSIKFLRGRAERTPDRRDDDIVRELEQIDDDSEHIENSLGEFSRMHESESRKLTELEDLRRRFKSERFDDAFSEFRDWALIALVIREFMRGAAGSGDVWKTIRRQQRTKQVKANPNFGSMRFPKAPKAGPFRMPKGGGFKSGGGFRTGGGFRGGGGFKTGGGF